MDTAPSPIDPQDLRLMEPAVEVDPNGPEALATAKLLHNYMLTQDIHGVGTRKRSLDIRVNVASPLWIRVSGWSLDLMDPLAKPVQLVAKLFEGFLARILRHEINHTNNVTIVAYIDEPSDVHHVPQSKLDEHRESHVTWPPAPRHLWHRLLRFTRPRPTYPQTG